MSDVAAITGIGGQDGSYLAELLLSKNYRVVGIVRPGTTVPQPRLAAIADRIDFQVCDLRDTAGLAAIFRNTGTTEVYNLAAPSFVQNSWQSPTATSEVIGMGTISLLDAIRQADDAIRFFQASSCEVFGAPAQSPQTEDTAAVPNSPYGAAKLFAQNIARIYREAYGLHASVAIAYNHESPRRDSAFVSKKITRAAAAIKLGLEKELTLGNLDARRDWGYAPDFVDAFHRIARAETPTKFIVATGESHSVREFCELAFAAVGLDANDHVRMDPRFVRAADSTTLIGDTTKIRETLGWKPTVSFDELVKLMVNADLASLSNVAG